MLKRDVIAAELRRLETESGRLSAEEVVRAASDSDSPLHDQFEWNDAKAGHAYRVDQARALIRSVRVQITVEERQISTVAYVRDPEAAAEGAAGYRAVRVLRGEPDQAHEALLQEFSTAAAHLRRARDLGAALKLSDEAQRLADEVEGVRDTARARIENEMAEA